MAILVLLWPYLLTTKLSCLQKNNFGHNIEGECQIEEDNFLQALFAKSELQCWLQCSINDHCKYYTWFSNENEDVSDECLLFSSCQTINDCNGGCYFGQVEDCYETTTLTPDTTTTSNLQTGQNQLNHGLQRIGHFFANLAYIAYIRQNQNLHRDIIILTDVTGTLYIVSIRLAQGLC